MKEELYRRIDFDDFYLENPDKHRNDPDAFSRLAKSLKK
jgi:hypothetical protein